MDHKFLKYFKVPQKLNQRQARWHYKLALYNFKIKYICGAANIIPDLLSHDTKFNFEKEELDMFNNITILLESLFYINNIEDDLETIIINA